MASPDHDVSRRRGDVGPHRHLEDQTDHLLFFCHLSSPVARHYSHASLSLRSPCGTCWFAPKICSSLPWCGCLDMLAPLECVAGELQRPRRRSAQWACADGWHVRAWRRTHVPTSFLFWRHGCSAAAKFACLQRQKPAMFAQMPLFVYRHFTGAVCTT